MSELGWLVALILAVLYLEERLHKPDARRAALEARVKKLTADLDTAVELLSRAGPLIDEMARRLPENNEVQK